MRMKLYPAFILVASTVFGVAFAPAHADTVAPNSLASSPGNAQGPTPLRYFGTGGSRVQEVFSSSFFSTGLQLISAIQFRPTPGATPSGFLGDTVNVSDIQVRLATTSFLDESGTPLSPTFATNLGLAAQTVFSGALNLQTAAAGSPVRDFDYTITLQTPFLYNPAAGNLLLDVLIPTTATVSGTGFGFIAFDSVNTLNDGIYSVLDINNGAALVGTPDTSGAIARFVSVSAVPEPETYAMMIAGLGVMGFFARRRKQKKCLS